MRIYLFVCVYVYTLVRTRVSFLARSEAGDNILSATKCSSGSSDFCTFVTLNRLTFAITSNECDCF